MRRQSLIVSALVALAAVGLFVGALILTSDATSPQAALPTASAAETASSPAVSSTVEASTAGTATPVDEVEAAPATSADPDEDPQILDKVWIGGPPTGVGFAFGSVWVMTDGGTISRVDPAADRVIATLPGEGFPVRAVGGFGSLWVTNCGAGYVSRINPDTNAVIATIPTGACPFGIATFAGAVWVANGDDHVSRIEPATNRVRNIHVRLASCPVDQCSDGGEVYRELAVGFGAVWIAGHRGQVMRVDPGTDAVTAVRIAPGLAKVGAVAVGFGSVWAASAGSGSELVRISPQTLEVTARIRTQHPDVGGGVPYGGRMWFGETNGDGAVAEAIDPATNTSAGLVRAAGTPDYTDVVPAAGALWVKAYSPPVLYRVVPT